MRKKIVHNSYPWPDDGEPNFKHVIDFLPKPKDLVFRVKTQDITLPVREDSLALYKKFAKQNKISIENMLATILDTYATQRLDK